MSTMTEQAPWEKYEVSRTVWMNLDREGRRKLRYKHWYKNNKKERNRKRRQKYDEDDAHKQKILDACKARRPAIRRVKAKEKFDAKLEEGQQRRREREVQREVLDNTARGGGRRGLPRYILVNGETMWVHTSRKLAETVGRGSSTIRAWMSQKVLPGCTVEFPGKRYYFSKRFIRAVKDACRRLYYIDGNGSRDVLAGLILEELSKVGASYVPIGSGPKDRVFPQEE